MKPTNPKAIFIEIKTKAACCSQDILLDKKYKPTPMMAIFENILNKSNSDAKTSDSLANEKKAIKINKGGIDLDSLPSKQKVKGVRPYI